MHARSTGWLSRDVIWEPDESYNHGAAREAKCITITDGRLRFTIAHSDKWRIIYESLRCSSSKVRLFLWSKIDGANYLALKLSLFRWWISDSVAERVWVQPPPVWRARLDFQTQGGSGDKKWVTAIKVIQGHTKGTLHPRKNYLFKTLSFSHPRSTEIP